MKKCFTYACSLSLLLIALTGKSQSGPAHYTGKIIDTHVHIAVEEGESNSMSTERTNTLKDVLAFMSTASIVKAGIITMAQKGNMADTRLRNDSVIALSKKYNSLIPICSVHPMDGEEAFAEMERVHKQGVKIIKLHPNYQRFDVAAPEVAALAHKAGELDMVLLFDSYSPLDGNEIGKLIMLAVGNQKAQFIFAHMGLVNFPQLLTIDALKKYPWYKNNIWLDVSAVAPILGDSPFHDQLVWTMRKIGIDQFLFGSDFPVFDPLAAIKSVHAMGFTQEEEKKIFYTNACRLLQLQP
ncbi:putative TIM-barrel fold metal-dependent hydrolase [Chitinophaga niastensis]|uniref:Putative TIM-barrel fold metal-dependent hydrolase n=1 Tax=Chitinophaga niastensis TaxID=536980 RepID=A0A2P8HTD9_CHINA|nr:amidohydrolase family protein [Chitinophaga niastensis]PSL49483.1 putative TIM-barrel fold metal-dependent hydrolase [Chitinophaga niastensis]